MRHFWSSLILLLLFTANSFANHDELYLDFDDGEILVERFENSGSAWRYIWVYSQYENLAEQEREFMQQIQANGQEVWAVDVLSSLFMTRSASSARGLDGKALAVVLQEAELESAKDGKGILVISSDRMSGFAMRGVRELQAQNLGKSSHLKGSILIFPNMYASLPVAGEDAEWEEIVSLSQAPVMVLQPEQGVHRWHLASLRDKLNLHGAPVYSWILPGVKDYFLATFDERQTDAEREMSERMPKIFELSAKMLADKSGDSHPAKLVEAMPKPKVKKPAVGNDPKLHKYATPRPAPDLVGETYDGKQMDLADLKGKVVLVNFWASWCPPCVKEIPSMNRLLDKYQAQGLEIFSVDFQQTPEEIAEFVAKVPTDYPILLDLDGKLSKNWGVFSFPTTFVMDKNGDLIYSLNQGVEWDIPELEAPLLELLAK